MPPLDRQSSSPLGELRDAMDDAIFAAFAEGWCFMGEPVPADLMRLQILEDPSKMRALNRIQAAAWDAVKERVE